MRIKRMQLTKPAQAMKLRSSSAVLGSRARLRSPAMEEVTFRRQLLSVCCVVLLLAVGGCSRVRLASVVRSDGVSTSFLFRNVSAFDGVTMLRNQDVVSGQGRIEAIGPTGTLSIPANAIRIDGAGKTLLPGLVDSHVHLFSAGEKDVRAPEASSIGEALLFAGVTSALVAAGFSETTALVQDSKEGRRLAPHLWTSGPGLTGPGGHPIPLLRAMLPWPISWLAIRDVPVAGTADEARAAVRKIASEAKPQFLKIIYDDLPPGSAHLSQDALRAAVAQARALGLRPLVHTTTPDDTLAAAEAGAALLAHIPQRGILTDDQVGRLKTLGVPFVTTVRLLAASRELAKRGPTPLERSMVDGRVLDAWRREPAWGLRGFSEALDQHFDEVAGNVRMNFRKLLAAGIPLYVGTDSGVHGVFPGSALHSEMRTLVELGMPPLEVLRLTTSAPAAFLDPSGAFGRIAPGAQADLLLVRGDPSSSLDALDAIEEVFLGGVRLERRGL